MRVRLVSIAGLAALASCARDAVPPVDPATAATLSRVESAAERHGMVPDGGAATVKPVADEIAKALAKVDPSAVYRRVSVPDGENAFTLWAKGVEKLVECDEDDLGDIFNDALGDAPFPKGEVGRRLAVWLARNEEALALIDEGVGRGRCQFPEIDGAKTEMPYLAGLRQVARVKLIKAKMLASRGRHEGAAEELLGIVRMAELISAGEGAMIVHLVGMACEGMGVSGARWLARSPGVSQEALSRLAAGLAPSKRERENLARSFRVEFTCFFVPSVKHLIEQSPADVRAVTGVAGIAALLPLVDMEQSLRETGRGKETALAFTHMVALAAGKEGLNPAEKKLVGVLRSGAVRLLDLEGTIRTAGAYYARLVRSARASWRDRDRNVGKDFEAFCKTWQEDLSRGTSAVLAAVNENRSPTEEETAALAGMLSNPVGRILTGLLFPAMEAIVERSFRTRADRAATRAALALRLHEMRRGRLPDSLDAVVAEGILDAVPVDPLCDEPLRYSKERRVVWSTGPDGKDDGGKDKSGNRPGKWLGKDYVLGVPGGE